MKLFNINDKVALVACSNGFTLESSPKIEQLIKALKELGLDPILSPVIYRKNGASNGTGLERAEVVNRYFSDPEIKGIFDISGGDLANETLEYLDYELIKANPKPYFGYSDLSTILNALNEKCKIPTYHYQVRNLIGDDSENQIEYFKKSFMGEDFPDFKYEFIRGTEMEGIITGGNIRCLLKLIGTEYQPVFDGKILFFEGLSGDSAKMATFLTQYRQIGAFNNLKGIILGTFTEMEKNNYKPTFLELLLEKIPDNVPIIKSYELGHGQDCKCLIIGNKYSFTK